MEPIILKQVMKGELLVPSESCEGAYYLVKYNDDTWTCTCPVTNKAGKKTCKHIERAGEVI